MSSASTSSVLPLLSLPVTACVKSWLGKTQLQLQLQLQAVELEPPGGPQ